MRPGNCFIIFIGISLSWVVYFMSNLLISFKIPSEVTDVKEKAASMLTLDTFFLIIEIPEFFWYFFSFNSFFS